MICQISLGKLLKLHCQKRPKASLEKITKNPGTKIRFLVTLNLYLKSQKLFSFLIGGKSMQSIKILLEGGGGGGGA